MEKLTEYLIDNKIKFEQLSDNVLEINGNTYCLVRAEEMYLENNKGEKIRGSEHQGYFSKDFEFVHSDMGYDYFVFYFGARYYYTPMGKEVELNELKYLGQADTAYDTETFLGVHGGYELLSGSRGYDDWTKKAKFLGVENLGICEKNTLAGTLKFQLACQKAGIRPIIGETVTVKRADGTTYQMKLYVKNDFGWINLLDINYDINNEARGYVDEEKLLSKLEGLFPIIDPKTLDFDDLFPLDLSIEHYALDTVEYHYDDRDYEYLVNLKKYVDSDLKPVMLTDAFYLDKEDAYIKDILASLAKVFGHQTENQYFKDKDDSFIELSELISDDDRLNNLFIKSLQGEVEVVRECQFNIETGKRRLPQYEMTTDEKELYGTNENMFYTLIEEGLEKLYPNYGDEELSRIEKEVKTIEDGSFIDYFLTTRDIVNYAKVTKSNLGYKEILTAPGRGSGAGALIAALLGITLVDPLEFDLLFERFLNAGRIGEKKECDVALVTMEDGTQKEFFLDDLVEVDSRFVRVCDLTVGDNLK